MSKALNAFDKEVRRHLKNDQELFAFFKTYFSSDRETKKFITRCVQRIKTRRMMLRLNWYADLANKINMVEPGRPALPLIFLLAMAEGVEKLAVNKDNDDKNSKDYLLAFFKYLSEDDRQILRRRFRRSIASRTNGVLRVSSIVKILWHARCNAAHGREYWHFLLPDQAQAQKVTMLTFGELGKPNRKRQVVIDTTLALEDLRDIIVRTAIRRIALLKH